MRKMMQGKLDIVEEIQNDDGTWTLVFEVDDEFKEWFKEYQELKRWSHKRFQKVLHEALLRLEFDEGRNSKWYDCAHCDAGYPDQECTCGRTKNENKHARQKEIDEMVGQVKSAATKAVHKVAEQHKEAFDKLAKKE